MTSRLALSVWVIVLLAAAGVLACERPAPDAPPPASEAGPVAVPDLLPFDDSRFVTEGGLESSVVRRVVGKHKSSFKVCYRRALEENPSARGDVRVRFTVSPTGRVSTVEVDDISLNSAVATACLTRVVRRLRFPEWPGQGRATVTYPMTFAP